MRVHDSRRSALHYAYKLLSFRSRSESEMAGKLRMKGFGEPEIGSTMLRLKEAGLLDDRRLAASLKRYAEETKHLSVRGARRFLIERGVPAEIRDEAVKDIDEAETARRLVSKKLAGWRKCGQMHEDSLDARTRKLRNLLCRRGYPFEAIREVLGEMKNKEDLE